MSRKITKKVLINTRLLKNHGSWIYCMSCNKTIAYLCYVTYNSFKFDYFCKCGEKGSVLIQFDSNQKTQQSLQSLIKIKNRFCCPNDNSPLVTFVDKNLESYDCEIVCQACNGFYRKNSIE